MGVTWKWLLLVRLQDGQWYAPSRTRSDGQKEAWLSKGGKYERRAIPYQAKHYHKVVDAKVTRGPAKPRKKPAKATEKPKAKKAKPKAKKAPSKTPSKATKKLRELVKPKKPRKPIKAVVFRGLAEEYAEEVKHGLERMFTDVKAKMGGSTFVFHNRNHTVDALWKIPVAHGQDMTQWLLRVEHALASHGRFTVGLWISSGIIFPQSSTTPDHYDRWKTLLQVLAYPQRWRDRHENLATLRGIVKNMAKRRRRKAQFVIIKLHWNIDDIKPTREEMTSK